MEHPLPVRCAQRTREAYADLQHLGPRQREIQIRQIVAANVLRDQVEAPLDLADPEDRHHVRVMDPGDRAGLDEKALALRRIRAERPEELHRHRTIENDIAGQVDRAHAPATELPDDPVLVELFRRGPLGLFEHYLPSLMAACRRGPMGPPLVESVESATLAGGPILRDI